MKAIIFGSGGVGLTVKEKLEDDGITVVAFADNNEKKWGSLVEQCKVIPPQEIRAHEYDYIAIAVYKSVFAIREQLLSLGVMESKIITPIEPEHKIFINPSNYTEKELVALSQDNYDAESNKKYEKLQIEVDDAPFLAKLAELKNVLYRNNIPREKVCVVKGSVMIAYGLRASKRFEDIDIIMTEDLRRLYGTGNVYVSENIEMVAVGYLNGRKDDEIINDVNNHFIFDGLKFMKLEDFYRYKRDIQLVKPQKPGLVKDLRIVADFIKERAEYFPDVSKDELFFPVKQKEHIFVNPVKYTERELLEISKNSRESELTKEYEKIQPNVEDGLFYVKLEKLKQILFENNIPREKVCVVRGAVMVAYGLRKLRKGEDIDIIMTEDLRELYGRGYIRISDDVVMSAMYYMNGRNEDEIIKNTNKHFVFQGLKFMNLEDVYEFKREVRMLKASKPEVIEDLAILKKFFNSTINME